MNLLEIKNVNKSFDNGKIKAAQNINLEVKKGEIFTILGRSGCGKSTLLRMIAGFETPQSGEIVVDKNVVFSETIELEPKQRELSIVFQNYALFPHMSVSQNILFGFEKEGRDRLDALLQKAGIQEIKDRYPHEISGGQQQRVALIRSLIRAPKVLLLDEPLSNIDIELRVTLRKELKEMIKNFGITALFVTHDKEDAFTISDRVAIVESGEILQIGTPKDIYNHPKSEYIARFLGKINVLNIDNKKIGVRAENFIISEDGDIEITVLDSTFHGAYFEILSSSEYGTIVLFSNSDIEIGEKIKLTIKEKILF